MKGHWARLKNTGLLRWLRPHTGVKRLIFAAFVGFIAALSAALSMWGQISPGSLQRFRHLILWMIAGIVVFLGSLAALVIKLWLARRRSGMGSSRWGDEVFRRAMLDSGPRIVAIGGGSGMSVLLRGLKMVTSNLTAVVTVADNGGNSGQLREDLGVLPPGDIRNCIAALSQVEPEMERLLQYRFKEGSLQGQCLGNLLLVAMGDISGGFLEGIRSLDDVLAVTGQVLPVSLENISLNGVMSTGEYVYGESALGMSQRTVGGRIQRVWLEPADAQPLDEVLEAIRSADMVILGPGSLYTSLMPNLLIPGVCSAIMESGALRIYVANVMTQPGETQGYTLEDHLMALEEHCGRGLVQIVLANRRGKIPADVLRRYREDGAEVIGSSPEAAERHGARLVEAPLVSFAGGVIRHQSDRLALKIMDIYKKYKEGKGR